ncbi:MAG: 3-oxoacyl-[acyl-carrier-protein] reductase [Alkalibacterium sp.]|uniref:3-oxoacyl-[acyl-carrier-protein] reductase n=1 Tax=Alkalibacterium gilvum TaxID=1130080 RepID=A0A1H6QXI9_9LACT|nr:MULTISPECIES: 3-oxoacyl-[acyl-carrier-protein] reductase [Alkalibacterium]MDN6293840.1 3-oxoacyl-[acyl-carrier-protein] reductase [Alkalibacterium sp.]MDN6294780.1 3-oxoacyl-[acyl-carrier-protein] reductase [Alkalibacterium sp.]MDN6326734.1 3-oxoacyl-[acyl-carrier-protein] reductase [Alkalibacterium sp.]MDN6385161.1 3-oxoacyl-[acyl-carrier-protein] reductase [Alkalibacterium sp.]MDN6397550.1 3-oxoacyl-[acyl-carrier-protein] reductase [Alkalibacterium sp.]
MDNKKVVIVTGSSRGIGKAIASSFLKDGHTVVVNGRSEFKPELLEYFNGLGGKAHPIIGDISDETFVKKMIKETKKTFKKIDVLVNNAGLTKDNLLIRMSEEDFDATLSVNLKGTFFTAKEAAKVMLKQRSGHIINISSVVGTTGNVGQANYAASKAGVIGFTKTIAKELAPRGVVANAIAPGFIESDMTDGLTDEIKEQALQSIPLKRLGTAEEIAELVNFLSDQKYITGQVLHVDGGMVMNG